MFQRPGWPAVSTRTASTSASIAAFVPSQSCFSSEARIPGQHTPTIPPGLVSNDLVTFTDFFQTMCDAAGLESPSEAKVDGQSFLPQLKGEKGNPRQWIYCFYARNGGIKGQEFVRNQRYKLYRSGEFFDIERDVLEKKPLDQGELPAGIQAIRDKLQKGLEQYTDARPEKFAKWNSKDKKKK